MGLEIRFVKVLNAFLKFKYMTPILLLLTEEGLEPDSFLIFRFIQ